MKLAQLAGGDVSAPDLEIAGLTADSREVKPGFLFAALRGIKADGRDFIPDALARGAAAVLAEPGMPEDLAVPVIEDREPRRRLAEMAARFYPRQPATVVAVTGTNGKSSTVEFLRQIWAAEGFKSAALGTLGVTTDEGRRPLAHTTPDPVAIHAALDALARDKVTHVALEASSHGLVQHRLDAVRIGGAGFTNLTQDHFDYHPDFEDYFAAKMRLFSELAVPGAPVAINSDGEWGARVVATAKAAGLDVRTFGWSGEALKLVELWPRASGQRIEVKLAGRDMRIELPLVGEFQALNALGAATLAIATGVSPETALATLTRLTGVPGRLELAAQTAEGAPMFVDYAHTPDGLDKVLRALRPHTKGRIFLVFGCGGDRDPKKRTPMGEIAGRLADVVFVTDDNPRTEDPAPIRAAILEGCEIAVEISDRAHAIGMAAAMLRGDDALVIAGKGHETGQILGDRVLPFSDVEEARKAAAPPKDV
jgi:UDP-N-acetylmuramoyl-L-alanyl-D-glutamate--2,6-diaminopimelate ligase